MSNKCDWDVIIVGGGLAGLAMAVHLCEPLFSHWRVLVLERRSNHQRDRTWSYFGNESHLFDHLVRRTWSQWRLSHLGSTVNGQTGGQYSSIDSDSVYRFALNKIAGRPNLTVRCGVNAQIEIVGNCARVQLQSRAGNEVLNARWIMDATGQQVVPLPAAKPSKARTVAFSKTAPWVQHFLGWEVKTSAPVFDAACVDLMAFEPFAEGLHFFYVLPYSATQALVEATWVSPPDVVVDYRGALQRHLGAMLKGNAFEVLFEEQGRLQLNAKAVDAALPPPNLVCLGAAGGTLRPSTGYAFLETLRHIAQVANWLRLQVALESPIAACGEVRNAAYLPRYTRPWRELWMDRVLFVAMQNNWNQAPSFFMAMFSRVKPQDMAAFMGGNASARQCLEVASTLPKWPFIKAAVQLCVMPRALSNSAPIGTELDGRNKDPR